MEGTYMVGREVKISLEFFETINFPFNHVVTT
jgi:hypothetical protein